MRGRAAAAAALLVVAAPALAGRPFATEDAGVLEAAHCEFEAFAARLTARAAPKETGWWVQPGCGIGYRSQLALGGGRTKSDGAATSAVALAGKTFLRRLKDDRFGITLAYQFTGQTTASTSFELDGTDLDAVLSAPLGSAVVHGNLGWNRSRLDRIDATTWAVAIEMPIAGGVEVGAESYGDDRTPAWIGVGARFALVADRLFVDMSYAVQADGARARLLTVGMKLALD